MFTWGALNNFYVVCNSLLISMYICRQKDKTKNAATVATTSKDDPLGRIQSKLSQPVDAVPAKTSGTGDAATTTSAAPVKLLSTVAAVLSTDGVGGAGGSDELISPRSAEVAPALVSMRHAGVAPTASWLTKADPPAATPTIDLCSPSAPVFCMHCKFLSV